MANRITTIIDLKVDSAVTSLRNLKNEVGAAEGFMGKLKTGISGLGNTIGSIMSSPVGITAMGAGVAAAGKFAFDAVEKFSALGVEVGQLSDATGLSADAASRWIEIASDVGIESGTLETGIGRLNKAIGNTPELFTNAGIEIAKTKDGAVDVNGTFLNLIKRLNGMRDPADRAALAAKVLGKGWQGMSELIGQGSDKLAESLGKVSEAKVFDEAKVAKAREFRAAMDTLNDTFEDIVITLGTELAPALVEIIDLASKMTGAWSTFFGWEEKVVLVAKAHTLALLDQARGYEEASLSQEELAEQMRLAVEQISETDRETRKLPQAWELTRDAEEEATEAANKYKRDADNTARSVKQNIDEMIGKWNELTGDVEDDKAWLTLQGQFDELRIKAEEAYTAAATGAVDAEAKSRDYQIGVKDLILDTINYGKTVADLPPEKLVLIKAAIDAGDIDRAEEMLAILTRNRDISIGLVGKGAAGYNSGGTPSFASGTARVPGALGQPMMAVVHGGEEIVPAGGNGGGGPTNVTIMMPVGSNGDDVIRAIKKWENRNGPGWRS